MGAVCLAAFFAGFAPSFYLRDGARGPLSALFLVHGAILTAWYLIAAAQPFWVASSRFHLHRAFGAGALSVLGAYTRRDGRELDNQGMNEALNSMRTAPNPQDTASNAFLGKFVWAPDDQNRHTLTPAGWIHWQDNTKMGEKGGELSALTENGRVAAAVLF